MTRTFSRLHPTLTLVLSRRTLAAALVSATLLGVAGLSASVQAQGAQPSVAEGRQALEQNKGGLTGDAAAIKTARRAILAPLTPGLSVADRQEYAQSVVGVIRPLAWDEREEVAINALRIAGELGTKDGMDVLGKGLLDKRPGPRMTAALGFARAFGIVAQTQPAVSATQVGSAVASLKTLLASEADPHVNEGLVLALDAASRIPQSKLEEVHSQALDAMVAGASTLAQRSAISNGLSAPGIAPAMSRAAQSLFEFFNTPSTTVSDEQAKAAAGLAGDMIAMVDRELVGNPGIETGERGQLAFLTGQALRIYDAASAKVHGPAMDLKLDTLVTQSKDEEFKAEAAKLIGAQGVLTKPPFGVKAERFALN